MEEFSKGDPSRKTLEVPAELLKALANDEAAKSVFESLLPDERQRVIEWVKEGKSQREMQRRSKEAIQKLRAGRFVEPI